LKNIFLTGASSFVGTNLIPKLSGFNIYALEHKTTLKKSDNLYPVNLKDGQFNEFYVSENIDTIIHLAANSNISDNLNDIENLIETNVVFGNNILLSTKKSPVKKFVYAGSYSQDIKEVPSNFYKISKQIFELLLENFSNENNIHSTSFHFGDIYGPNDKRDKLIPYILKNENNNSVKFNSNGLGYFSPIHIDDVTNSIIFDLEKTNSQIFEKRIVCSDLITVKEFVNIYKNVRKKHFTAIFSETNRIKYFEPINLNPNFLPTINIEEGLNSL
tara:strand:- start:531 stop:1349 length:819 start_codon:yes stop_codon:yes gene_type:complete